MVVAVCATLAAAEGDQRLIAGWTKATWGMTHAKVVSTFKSDGLIILDVPNDWLVKEGTRNAGYEAPYRIPNYRMGTRKTKVEFLFPYNEDWLAGVGVSANNLDEEPAAATFTEFETLLTHWFGARSAASQSNFGGGKSQKIATWILPETLIELKVLYSGMRGANDVTVLYQSPSPIYRNRRKP
jgi:hypothetical protein